MLNTVNKCKGGDKVSWEFTSEKPIHIQLVNEISNRIIKGEYAPGMKLPSVRDFAAQASVNPNTMQRALSALETGGLIFSERTAGRFVTNNLELIRQAKEELAKSNVENFFSSMAELGYSKDDAITMANELKE